MNKGNTFCDAINVDEIISPLRHIISPSISAIFVPFITRFLSKHILLPFSYHGTEE